MPEHISSLGAVLKARRREKRLSLRDLADETGVSFNTLSRVERGHIPDLKNFERIIAWLDVPASTFLKADEMPSTPQAITRHLLADRNLSREAATQIAEIVEEMYRTLVGERPQVAVHLRSAKTFTPAAGALLADILAEMQSTILHDE